jgi:hypothetical protein
MADSSVADSGLGERFLLAQRNAGNIPSAAKNEIHLPAHRSDISEYVGMSLPRKPSIWQTTP